MTDEPTTEQVLESLTLAEKAALTQGSDIWHTAPVDRVGVRAVAVSDGPHGLRKQPDEGDHIGLGGSLPATCFPTASALASSWDPALVERVGRALGREARAQDVAVLLGPGVNIKRSPLCGRNFEYFSEDPLLAGVLGAAWVAGVQAEGVGASLKHFAVNNQETDRLRVSAEVDERTLREIYLPAFEHVVRTTQPWTVMCAYNRVNGTWASEHHQLLTQILREEWGFEGLVVSDWGAVADRVRALRAGLDLQMPPALGDSEVRVVAAVEAGELAEAVLDRSVTRVLELVRRSATGSGPDVDVEEHHALALEAARRSVVLLRNDGAVLPLSAEEGGARVAVVGELARTPRFQGAGSSQVNPTRVESALDALRELAPEGAEVVFEPGYTLDDETDDRSDEQAGLVAAAVAAARGPCTVLAFLGLPPAAESEGFDREHMLLPPDQLRLLAALAEVNDRVVVVLTNGSAVTLEGVDPHARAVLEAWLPGQAGGRAIAEVLWGRAEPSGRLAESIPLRAEDAPSHLNFPGELGVVRYGEGVFVGYRGYDASDRPVAYPFGHGLGYTTFAYDDLDVATTGSALDGDLAVDVSCRVTNTGDRAGAEVVQVYVGGPDGSVLARPPRELRGFGRVELEPGESATVAVRLEQRAFAAWRPGHGWWVEDGVRRIEVGASSRDLRLRADLAVEGSTVAVEVGLSSTLEEWVADPALTAALRELVGTDADGRTVGVLGDPELMRVVGNFPVDRLATFPGMGFDRALLQQALDRAAATER